MKGNEYMRNHVKLLLTALTAAVVMAAVVGAASANRLSVNVQGQRIVWTELTFAGQGEGGENAVICDVTLEGSFHSRTIVKTPGLLIGHISRASVNMCEGLGGATILTATLPWHVRYAGFSGTLPNIRLLTIHLVGANFRIGDVFGFSCLSTTTATNPGIGNANREAGGNITTLEASGVIPARSGGTIFGCPFTNGTFSGNGEVTQLGNTSRISITLI
jgi:hypothetical protein